MTKLTKQIISGLMIVLMMFSSVQVLSITSLAADAVAEKESNDGSNTATVIPVDTNCIGWLGDEADIDWYKFTTDKDYFTFSFEIDMNETNYDAIKHGWDVLIYTDNGTNIIKEYKEITESFTTAILPFNGTYYIKILASNYDNPYYSPINCKYNIKVNTVSDASWENEWNDTSATAFGILSDKTYHGTFHLENDVDWFRFENKKDNFKLNFKINDSVSYDKIGYGWKVGIYLNDGVTLIKEYEEITENFVTPELPFKGEYLIKIYADYAAANWAPIDCYYDITVNTISDKYWEKENNDSTSTATKISINKNYTGFLYSQSDVDNYVFEAKKGAFNIEFVLDKSVSADAVKYGWKIALMKYGSSEPIIEYKDITTDMVSFDIPYKGKFVLVVSADYPADNWAPIDCYYKLKIADHPDAELWEAEDNDYMKKATSISNKKTYNANMDNEEDVDYYKFKALYNGTMKLNFSRDISDEIGRGWKVSVLKANGVVISEKIVKDDIDTSISVAITKGETYYVKVECEDTYYARAHRYINYSIKVTTSLKTANVSGLKSTVTKDTIKLSWNKIAGVTGYKIYKYNSSTKKYTLVATTSKNSYTIKKLSSGTTYVYYVKAYQKYNDKDYLSNKYTKITTATKPDTPTLKVTAGKKAATLNWSKEIGTGYVVYMATSKNGTYSKIATVKGVAKVSYVKKSLTTGKTYYFKVRAYKTVGDQTLYGSYSSIKSVKVK